VLLTIFFVSCDKNGTDNDSDQFEVQEEEMDDVDDLDKKDKEDMDDVDDVDMEDNEDDMDTDLSDDDDQSDQSDESEASDDDENPDDDVVVCSPVGTTECPIVIDSFPYLDDRDTNDAVSDEFDTYPPNELDESGNEFIYTFLVTEKANYRFNIQDPEPENTDIDLHLLDDSMTMIERADKVIEKELEPGTYYLSMDTYENLHGEYKLRIEKTLLHDGTLADPHPIDVFPFFHEHTTVGAVSDEFDSYPPNTVDESGPEYIYSLHVDKKQYYYFSIRRPEADGVDVDLQLFEADSPYTLIERDDKSFFVELEPGDYLFSIDTFSGDSKAGEYVLSVNHEHPTFNSYVLKAVDYLYENYSLLGYDSAVLTHDITYGDYGVIPVSKGAKTMCVAAVMEVILTAINIYADETGDPSVYDILPIRSWKYLGENDVKAHLWVNYDLNAGGTADALRNFNMGGNIPFEELEPGSFININRTTGTGHAVVFLSFIDIDGTEYTEHNEDVIGFKYFSSQGGLAVGAGGLDYRYAIFEAFGSPEMPYKRDINIIYSTDQHYLNTGVMFMPTYWRPATDYRLYKPVTNDYFPFTRFDPVYFNGLTVDDVE